MRKEAMPTTSADPLEFLEDGTDPRTVAWTGEQNARTRAALDAVPGRDALRARLSVLLGGGTIGCPESAGGRAFYVARRPGRQQAALFVREGDADRMLFDPLTLDPSGLTAIDWFYPSPNGALVVFGLSTNGDERSTLYLLDVMRGQTFGETIPDTRHCAVAWLPDEHAFYYTRFPSGSDYDQRIYLHTLGTPYSNDLLVFGEGREKEEYMAPRLSSNGRWLLVSVFRGWISNDVYLADLHGVDSYFVTVIESPDALYDAVAGDDRLFVRTNEGAPNFRVFEADPLEPRRSSWNELVAERRDAKIEAFALARGVLVFEYLRNVLSEIWWRPFDGELRRFEHPSLGPSVAALSARDDASEAFVLSAGFFQGPTVTRIDFSSPPAPSAERWDGIEPPFSPERYRYEQRWFVSKDGTRVPMFVLAAAATAFDGSAPAVLYGYGGFNISLLPSYGPSLVPWLDAGGVYAIANLRGGGEFGEEWHRAGMRERKQNAFDDFLAAAEYLGSSGIADPKRIGIFGGSNGGLLVAAATVQRPDLFRAVVCAVPLCDMLHYTKFSIARLWIPEYGDPDDPADATYLRAYSPYHNVRDGTHYPAFFAVAAEADSRVDPMHARKMGARLQSATASEAPVFVHIEAQAGHGVGKPHDKQVQELTDRWAFLGSRLGVTFAG